MNINPLRLFVMTVIAFYIFCFLLWLFADYNMYNLFDALDLSLGIR